MRTPQEYIADMKEEEKSYRIPPSSLAYNDQFHADVRRNAATVGLDINAAEFRASWLLAADLLDHLAGCLEMTEEVDREIGSAYIQDAASRLRLLSLWGMPCQKDCLDLR